MSITEKYKESIRQALKLALPIITGQLGLVLMGFFDTIQVGGLGSVYMGASGVSNSVYFLFLLLGMGVLFAVSPLVSEAFGEKHGWKSIGVMRSATKATIVISILFYCIILVVIQNFALLREGDTITGLAQKFLRILNYSTPMLLFFTLGKQFLDGMGRTKISMYMTLVGLVCNVFLNWVLIYGHLGLAAMGIEGAALATGISRTIMCISIIGFIFYDKKVRELYAEWQTLADKSKSYIKQILEIGVPSGLQMFFEVGAFSACQVMCGWIGENSLAAFQVAISLASITFMMVSGLGSAGTIMTGFAFGEKSREKILLSGNTVYLLSLIVQFFFAIVFVLFHNQLPFLYTKDVEVTTLASSLLIFASLFQISDGLQVVGAGILRGMQDTRVPSIIAFASYWVIMVPLGYVLAFKFDLKVMGVWIAFVIGLTIAAVLMYVRYRMKLKTVEFSDL